MTIVDNDSKGVVPVKLCMLYYQSLTCCVHFQDVILTSAAFVLVNYKTMFAVSPLLELLLLPCMLVFFSV